MIYRVIAKTETARSNTNGGGIRYRLELETAEPNGDPDCFKTHFTTEKEVFDNIQVGMTLHIPVFIVRGTIEGFQAATADA